MARRDTVPSELRNALASYRSAIITVIVISGLLNILLLGGSLYMMLVYDSVLPSGSVPTLIGLLLMVAVVYAFQGLFETMRGRMLSDIATGLDRDMTPRVHGAIHNAQRRGATLPVNSQTLMQDLDQIRGFLGGPGSAALIDLPWIFFFLAVLTILHVWLGVTALLGALVLIGLTWLTDRQSGEATVQARRAAAYRANFAEVTLRHDEIVTALGMERRMQGRWQAVNETYLAAQGSLTRTAGLYGGISKTFRMFLQSLILTVGALLVINGQASGGVIFAASILASRALAPVDQAIAHWRGFAMARLGWDRLTEMLEQIPPEVTPTTSLPRPQAELSVDQLVVVVPGTQHVALANISFTLAAGSVMGIIGPSAAGKTTLGRTIVGAWRPMRGTVRLDGATLEQWPREVLGGYVGYLPQSVELIEGTVAENIARFDDAYSSEDVTAAARAAGVHDMIVHLPQGYETPVGPDGAHLSAGQRQRLGLARALYGNPFLVVLDEPNSNLDAVGEAALRGAIAEVRGRGGIVIIIAHRPSVLADATHVLFLRNGRQEAFGRPDEVLDQVTVPALAA